MAASASPMMPANTTQVSPGLSLGNHLALMTDAARPIETITKKMRNTSKLMFDSPL